MIPTLQNLKSRFRAIVSHKNSRKHEFFPFASTFPKGKDLSVNRYLFAHVHHSIAHMWQRLEALQASINRGTDKKTWLIYSMKYYSA